VKVIRRQCSIAVCSEHRHVFQNNFGLTMTFFSHYSLPLSPLGPCGRLIPFLGGVAGLRDTFPGHPRPPSPLLFHNTNTTHTQHNTHTTQHTHNTTSMGGPSGRGSNPADLAMVVGIVFFFLPPPNRQPLKDMHTHPWPGGGSFLGKNPPPSVRFEPNSHSHAATDDDFWFFGNCYFFFSLNVSDPREYTPTFWASKWTRFGFSNETHVFQVKAWFVCSLINSFFRWLLVHFNINELFCLKYSVLMDFINTLFFTNQRFLRIWRFDDILMYKQPRKCIVCTYQHCSR
jgi:hypothetical protein